MYHKAITETIGNAIWDNGKAFLVDLHGFDQEKNETRTQERKSDLIIGSCGEKTIQTNSHLDERLCEKLSNYGYIAHIATANGFLSGGYTILHHATTHKINALQIGISGKYRAKDATEEGQKLAKALAKCLSELV